mgnify:CR=1 FL=1
MSRWLGAALFWSSKDCVYLRLRDLLRCFNLILWASSKQKLVSMAEV